MSILETAKAIEKLAQSIQSEAEIRTAIDIVHAENAAQLRVQLDQQINDVSSLVIPTHPAPEQFPVFVPVWSPNPFDWKPA